MDSSNTSVLFGILLYILYVLLPLIPAYIIYKQFPDTKVGASGLLGNLKVNSTGAFAAYIVVVVLGYFVVRHIQGLITFSVNQGSTWKVSSKVVFQEKNSDGNWVPAKDITDDDVEDKLDIRTNPNYTEKNLNEVDFITHSINGLPKITFSYPSYASATIDLNNPELKIDTEKKEIKLGTIFLQRTTQEYEPQNFQDQTSLQQLNLVPFGGPANNDQE